MRARKERQKKFMEVFANFYGRENLTEISKRAGISRRTYNSWRENYPEFRDAIDRLKAEIVDKLDDESPMVTTDKQWGFAEFRKRYLGFDSYLYHTEIARVLDTAPEGSISLILLPPGAGKTTCIEHWMAQKLALDPDHRILFISESQGEASKRLQMVQRYMTDEAIGAELMARWGPFYEDGQERQGKPWTRDKMTVAKRKSGERDYSLAALGMSSQIYGIRADTIILDDPQTMKTMNQTENFVARFRQEILSRRPSGGASGRVVIIATRIGEGDMYGKLIEEELIDEGQLLILPCTTFDADGEEHPVCPEMFPPDVIPRIKRQAGDSWYTAYQQKPHLGHNATFTEEMIDAAKDPLRNAGEARPSDERYVIGVDPALSGNTGIVVLGYNQHTVTIVDCVQLPKAGSQEKILDAIQQTVARYRPLDVVIETMAYQQALARDDRLAAMATRFGFRIRPHRTYGNKHDPLLGVSGMTRSFHLREFRIPDGSPASAERLEPVVTELRTWRPDVKTKFLQQDMVMALWFAWKFVMEMGRRPADASLAKQFTSRRLVKPTPYHSGSR